MDRTARPIAHDVEDRPGEAPFDLRDPALYINRELSWLDFNERVLELAEANGLPLLERAKFLAIFASNLDEFFMVRVAGLHDQLEAGIDARGPDCLSPGETIQRIAAQLHPALERQARAFQRGLCPALAAAGIRIRGCEECEAAELEVLDTRFYDQIFPVLTPLAVGPGRPFPYISNLSLSLAVWLRDPVSGLESFARVKVPKEILPRFVEGGGGTFVPLESVIARHLDRLFPGMEILHHAAFRVTRDADFTVSDEADDLLRAVEDELRRRRFGEVVRLEVGADLDPGLRSSLVDWLNLDEIQVYVVEGLLDLVDLWQLHRLEERGDLRLPPWVPVTQLALRGEEAAPADVFAAMRTADLIVHHPYDSFATSVERFVEQAVEDPAVLAIKLTVYRTSDDSVIVPALIRAAERGKQAVCMVELKARFDERRNISWARALEESGVHVVHGLPGLKTHAKALIVTRREGDGVRRYVHVGTGNYHARTARVYEDFGLFTTDPDIAGEVAELFNSLTGATRPTGFREVMVAPAYLRRRMLEEIARTVEGHRDGRPGRIRMKMNALVDRRCIEALYEASRAGVAVELNVRGICCLRPGVAGVSDRIRVVSVVGRFLEHSRIFAFDRGTECAYYIGSADLMPRNLDQRVELVVPVADPRLRADLQDTLDRCFADDTSAWDLDSHGTWRRRASGERNVQEELMEWALRRAAQGEEEAPERASIVERPAV